MKKKMMTTRRFAGLVLGVMLALHVGAVAVLASTSSRVARSPSDDGTSESVTRSGRSSSAPPAAITSRLSARSATTSARSTTTRSSRSGRSGQTTSGRITPRPPVEGVPETSETARVIYKLSADADAADKFSRGLSASAARASSAAARSPFVRTSSVKRLVPYSGKFEAEHVKWGLNLYYEAVVELSGASTSTARASRVASALSSLRSTSGVSMAEIEPEAKLLYSSTGEPNDPGYGSQSNYAHVKLDDVWKYVNGNTIGTAKAIIVQVIDAGTEIDHPDIRGKLWRNTGEVCDDGIDNDGNGWIDDCFGYNNGDGTGTDLKGEDSHGMHCSGTLLASTDNGVGVSGVAGGSIDEFRCGGVQLMTWTMFGKTRISNGGTGFVYGADMGARISSNSWGYTQVNAVSQFVLNCIDYFNARDQGNMVFFAAGNSASNGRWYPAYYEGAFAVASTGRRNNGAFYDALSSFSNYGSWVDGAAPGSDILSTCFNGGYCYKSGTSMACPLMAGAAALLVQACPSLPRSTIYECLSSTATTTPVSDPNGRGQGFRQVDTFKALQCVMNTGSCPYTLEQLRTRTGLSLPTSATCTADSPQPPAPAKVEIQTDDYGGEVSYSLTYVGGDPSCGAFQAGEEIASNTDLLSNTLYSADIPELCEGTYLFVIEDSFGDGICCAYGEGFYRVIVEGEVIYTSNGMYGERDEYEFTIGSSSPPQEGWVWAERNTSCGATCESRGLACDIVTQSTLTTQAAVRSAMASIGEECASFGNAQGLAGAPFTNLSTSATKCFTLRSPKESSCLVHDNQRWGKRSLCYCKEPPPPRTDGDWVLANRGVDCATTCSATGRTCDRDVQATLTTEAAMQEAMASVGYECRKFNAAKGGAGAPFTSGIKNANNYSANNNNLCNLLKPGKRPRCDRTSFPNNQSLCFCRD